LDIPENSKRMALRKQEKKAFEKDRVKGMYGIFSPQAAA